MGIQITDVRVDIHWWLLKTVLSYWQEIGRAGRDGNNSYAMFYTYGRSMIKKKTDEKIINIAKTILAEPKCLRQGALLAN